MRRRTGRSVCLIRVVEMADRFPRSREFEWLSGRRRGQQPHSATPLNVPTMSALSFRPWRAYMAMVSRLIRSAG